MTLHYYKSDLDFIIHLRDRKGDIVPWPDVDFEALFWTASKARGVTVSRKDGVFTGCFLEADGGLHVVMNDHRLGVGQLKWEPHFRLPNALYPDSFKDTYDRSDLDITLTDCPTDSLADTGAVPEIEAVIPAVYLTAYDLAVKAGFKGSFAEYTEYANRFPEVVEQAAEMNAELHDLCEDVGELRREIVGIWDDTAAIQAKLADLYSTETSNLLRRLGYGQEDIDEYIWALSHLNIDISMDELRKSAFAWESFKKEGGYTPGTYPRIAVLPKWDAEMEAGTMSFGEFLVKVCPDRSFLYCPLVVTGKRFYIDDKFNVSSSGRKWYIAGVHATAPIDIEIDMRGNVCLGSFTGQIKSFVTWNPTYRYPSYNIYFIKRFKSDSAVSMKGMFHDQQYATISNVDVANATDLTNFADIPDGYYMYQTDTGVPTGLSEMKNGVLLGAAFANRVFKNCTIDLSGRFVDAFYIFKRYNDYKLNSNLKDYAAFFYNCDIDISTDGLMPGYGEFDKLGYLIAPIGTKSRLRAHGFRTINPRVLASPSYFGSMKCGIWEVDCPDAEWFEQDYCSGVTCATFWNIGEKLNQDTIRLSNFMKSYHGKTITGTNGRRYYHDFFATNPELVESFRNSLKTWKPVPQACTILLRSEQLGVLTEEEIADLAEKGYTVAADYGGFPQRGELENHYPYEYDDILRL